MKELRDEGMGFNHGHLVEEPGRWKAKVMAGTRHHQTGWPGEDDSAGGQGPLSDPRPGFITVCDAWESTKQKEAMWVTVADEIQLGLPYSSDWRKKYKYGCLLYDHSAWHDISHPKEKVCFQKRERPKCHVRKDRTNSRMDGWIKLSWKSSPTFQEYL